jgi:4'-phosphopantetheinyl transferase|tara:strand:+ start:590 stop:1282 length:693 start_codon:yes stop_codon:yes gene_type:complete
LINKPAINCASAIIFEDITKSSDTFLKKCLESLDGSEINRVAKIKKIEKQQQFAVSRFLMKQTVKQKLAVPITINLLPTGKPYIPEWLIFCSISHSGNSIAVAFSTYSDIGIDIEIHRKRNFEKLVKNYFHPNEIETFNALEESNTLVWFYTHWTLKEAMAKIKGEGISQYSLSKRTNTTYKLLEQMCISRNNYSLSCVHYSKHPIQLEIATPLDSAPWIELTNVTSNVG